MGNCLNKLSSVFSSTPSSSAKVGIERKCPTCEIVFSSTVTYGIINQHLKTCSELNQDKNEDHPDRPFRAEQYVWNIDLTDKNLDFFWAKVPIQSESTKEAGKTERSSAKFDDNQKYRWERRAYVKASLNVKSLLKKQPKDVKNLSFEQKQLWFKTKCDILRIPWTEGADWISINSDNVLLNSMFGIRSCNLHKEVKIQIIGDKVNDAGGLLREWIHLCMKEIFDPNIVDSTYKINNQVDFDEHIIECFKLLGKILGKALFERITISAFFDRSIINYLLGRQMEIEDIIFFDKDLYQSWKFLLENQLDEGEIIGNFVAYGPDKKEVELIPNGKTVEINNDNKVLFIEKQIQFLCVDSIKQFLDAIRDELYKVIPEAYLQIFEPHELEMILNGVPFINLHEWKNNTEYQGYEQTDQTIIWFWKAMAEFNQEQLSKFLQYCTGSSRTPIDGFQQIFLLCRMLILQIIIKRKLESNRGNYAKFHIKQIEYNLQNPYPRAHTCFNRLELPIYPSFEALKMNLKIVVNNNLEGVYGLE